MSYRCSMYRPGRLQSGERRFRLPTGSSCLESWRQEAVRRSRLQIYSQCCKRVFRSPLVPSGDILLIEVEGSCPRPGDCLHRPENPLVREQLPIRAFQDEFQRGAYREHPNLSSFAEQWRPPLKRSCPPPCRSRSSGWFTQPMEVHQSGRPPPTLMMQ
jgi:hypothetical protein